MSKNTNELNGEIFYTLKESKVVIERWQQEFNCFRQYPEEACEQFHNDYGAKYPKAIAPVFPELSVGPAVGTPRRKSEWTLQTSGARW